MRTGRREVCSCIAVNVDDLMRLPGPVRAFPNELTFPILHGSDDVAAIYNILYRQLFDRHRDLSSANIFPDRWPEATSSRCIRDRSIPINWNKISRAFRETTPSGWRGHCPFLARASLEFGRNYLSYGALFFQRGYLDQAEVSFQQALRDNPSSAEALYGIGSVYLNQSKNADARSRL